MRKIKKITVTYVILMICVLTWASIMYFGKKKDTINLDLPSGDQVEVTLNKEYATKYKLKMTNNALYVEKDKKDILKISFVKESDWCKYIDNNVNKMSQNGEIINNMILQSAQKGEVKYFPFYSQEENTIAAWIIGTNTGVIVYGKDLIATDLNKLFKQITFTTIKTEQENNQYCPQIDLEANKDTENKIEQIYDFNIIIDNKKYEFPYSYNEFKENGWKISSDVDVDSIVLESGSVSEMMTLVNEQYGIEYDNFSILCQFKNLSNQVKPLSQCEICYLSLDAANGMKLLNQFPEVKLSSEIGFKSTEGAVIEKYGDPIDSFSNNYCSVLTYQNEEDQFLQFIIYEDYGVVGIELQDEIELLE